MYYKCFLLIKNKPTVWTTFAIVKLKCMASLCLMLFLYHLVIIEKFMNSFSLCIDKGKNPNSDKMCVCVCTYIYIYILILLHTLQVAFLLYMLKYWVKIGFKGSHNLFLSTFKTLYLLASPFLWTFYFTHFSLSLSPFGNVHTIVKTQLSHGYTYTVSLQGEFFMNECCSKWNWWKLL